MAEQRKKMNVVQLTFIVGQHDGLRHHHAADEHGEVGAISLLSVSEA